MGRVLKITLNVVLFLVIVGFVWYMTRMVNKETRMVNKGDVTLSETQSDSVFTTPYKDRLTLIMPSEINCFELYDEKLFIAADQRIDVYDTDATLLTSFPIKEGARDLIVEKEMIYVLYPTFIKVYDAMGQFLLEWEACSELSDYCSFAVAGDFLFVTDAQNKNICVYTKEGHFVKFITSPNGFVIPSYSFDIKCYHDTIYCVNSGRHLIEKYTPNGDFIAAFGGPGSEPGFFAGCCNPAYITFTSGGELLTSEKGNPRISSFERNGKFKEILLNSRLLGGGNKAYKIRIHGNQLFTVVNNKIVRFDLIEN